MTNYDFENKSEFSIFLHYFLPHKKLFFLDMICALAIAVIDLSFPFISRWCMYTLLPQNAWRTFWTVMSIVFLAYILRSIFTYVVWYVGHNFGIFVETDIRRDLFSHIQKLNFDYFDNHRTGELLSNLTTDLFDITELAHHGPEDMFVSSVTYRFFDNYVYYSMEISYCHCYYDSNITFCSFKMQKFYERSI